MLKMKSETLVNFQFGKPCIAFFILWAGIFQNLEFTSNRATPRLRLKRFIKFTKILELPVEITVSKVQNTRQNRSFDAHT